MGSKKPGHGTEITDDYFSYKSKNAVLLINVLINKFPPQGIRQLAPFIELINDIDMHNDDTGVHI